jgi:DnaJ-class molecular chaperone
MSAHLEIAKERFLDLLSNGISAPCAAMMAITDADAFMSSYSKHAPQSNRSTVGCRACHGSGGKRAAPCKVCGGTGKVPA